MSIPGSSGLLGGAGGLRFASTRGRIGNGVAQGVNYPSPFFDIAHTYLPVTVKGLFRWCRYYFMTSGTINAVVTKLAEYPITEILVDHPEKKVANRWKEYFDDHLNFRSFQIETGLDYNCYGNCYVTVSYPFKKFLSCAQCRRQFEASKIRPYWVHTNYEFRLSCPSCGNIGTAIPKDVYLKIESGVQLMRWSPEDIEVTFNAITGASTYFYNIPSGIRSDVTIGKKEIVEQLPEVFMQALRQQKGIVFAKDQFFHLRRPTLADQDRGLGIPLILPVLKDTFYLQLMKKAQEAILLEHVVPMRTISPQAGSGTSDPYTTINLVDWRDHVATEIANWRMDPNYIPILPLPIASQTIGGDGRALLLVQEMQMVSEGIINGMECPLEFIKGGLTYTGTSVSLRMLENQFIVYLARQKRMANWVMRRVADYLNWPIASIRFKPFKMADDIQRKAYLFQLNSANKISDTSLLADSDFDQQQESQIMERETALRMEAVKKQQMANAELQGEQQALLMKMQAKAQQEVAQLTTAPAAPGEPGGPVTSASTPGGQGGPEITPNASPLDALKSPLSMKQNMGLGMSQSATGTPSLGGTDIIMLAQRLAQQYSSLNAAQQLLAIKQLREQSPELADLVLQFLQSMPAAPQAMPAPEVPAGPFGGALPAAGATPAGNANQQAASQVNMQSLPDKLPPRRAASVV